MFAEWRGRKTEKNLLILFFFFKKFPLNCNCLLYLAINFWIHLFTADLTFSSPLNFFSSTSFFTIEKRKQSRAKFAIMYDEWCNNCLKIFMTTILNFLHATNVNFCLYRVAVFRIGFRWFFIFLRTMSCILRSANISHPFILLWSLDPANIKYWPTFNLTCWY